MELMTPEQKEATKMAVDFMNKWDEVFKRIEPIFQTHLLMAMTHMMVDFRQKDIPKKSEEESC